MLLDTALAKYLTETFELLQVAARLAAMRDAADRDGRIPAALAELHAAQAAAAQAIAQQVCAL